MLPTTPVIDAMMVDPLTILYYRSQLLYTIESRNHDILASSLPSAEGRSHLRSSTSSDSVKSRRITSAAMLLASNRRSPVASARPGLTHDVVGKV